MIEMKEWKWEKVKAKERFSKTLDCPYCSIAVHAPSDVRILDEDAGIIRYHIHKCPKCYMPIIISFNGTVIPKSQALPFGDVQFVPEKIEKMYTECRLGYLNGCYYSTIMLARTMIMHIAHDLGSGTKQRFVDYINYLESEGYISKHNKNWVDKIRLSGNQYIHQLDEPTEEDARKVMMFIKQLLGNVYEMPELAR